MTMTTHSAASLEAAGPRHGDDRVAEALTALAARLFAAWVAARARARAVRDQRVLRTLDDHVLRDIGLSRADLYDFE